MKINWRVRLRSYPFWVALFGFIGLLVNNSGLLDLDEYNKYVDAFMLVLLAGGVIADPTTYGFSDSLLVMNYKEPRNEKEVK